jgi:hypothetical protein
LAGRLAIALGALALAYFVTSFGLSLAAARANPAVALRLFPANADAKAKAAELMIDAQMSRPDWEKVRQLAIASLMRAPASSRAVRVLALADLARGSEERADKLMRLARSFSRRDFPTTLYLIEKAVTANRPQDALADYDIALRTTPSSYDMLFPILANAIEDDALLADFERLAASNPPWFPAFVASATYLSPPITNLSKLLMRHPDSPAASSKDVRAVVVARLARDGDYRRAFAYYLSLGRPGKALVRDEHITASSFLPPFEWSFESQEAFSGEAAVGGGLRFSAATGGNGEAASQLLMLSAGAYILTSQADIAFTPRDGSAEWSITCASGNAALLDAHFRKTDGGSGRAEGKFEVPAGCEAQKLALRVAADVNSQGIEGRVTRISILPLSHQGARR